MSAPPHAPLSAIDAIRNRRAVKQFDPTHRLSAEEERQIFELAQQTPSSFNLQHWRFVRITDPALRSKIREAAGNQAQVTDASLLLVICADVKAWDKNPEKHWQHAPEPARAAIALQIRRFYEGKEQLQRDEAMRSVGFVAQTMMLAVKAMGYDTSPMIGFDALKVAELIRLPEDHVIGMMLAIGKGLQPSRTRAGQIPLSDIIIENTF